MPILVCKNVPSLNVLHAKLFSGALQHIRQSAFEVRGSLMKVFNTLKLPITKINAECAYMTEKLLYNVATNHPR